MRRLVVMLVLCAPLVARAGDYTLTLERLIGPPTTPGTFNDPTAIPIQTAYRSLMSEMGVVFAPKWMSPSDTLGWSGFHLSFDAAFTSISNTQDYWQKGVRDASSGFLPTITVMARKGIWAPLPSFEIGAGASYLVDSPIVALITYMKFAIHEGMHKFPMPSIALRGAVSRPFGTSQVDMTVVSTDLSLSKSFGVGGTLKLDPYLGANLLLTIVKSQVIDTTPNVDAFKQGPMSVDLNSNTTFPDQDTILRWRLFVGLRLVWSLLAVSFEYAYTFCNDTARDCGVDSPTRITDRSDGQSTISLSAGLLF
jgi:hypothetical protein